MKDTLILSKNKDIIEAVEILLADWSNKNINILTVTLSNDKNSNKKSISIEYEEDL